MMPEIGLLIGIIAGYVVVCVGIVLIGELRERREKHT